MVSRTKKPNTKAARAKVAAPKRTAQKRTIPAKAATPKTPVRKKPVAAKKPALKKAALKKTSVVKKTAPNKLAPKKAKPTIAKPAAKKPAPQERDNLIKLRAHVNDIEKRLKRADSLTRSSVRALQKSYESLGARSGGADAAAPVAALSAHLTGMIEKTRADVAHDLRIVMEDPRLETVNSALNKANQRLTLAEREQASAISTINTQIAELAQAVDNRMARETRERERVQEVLSNRIDEVESMSANAMQGVGDKVAEVTDELSRRAGEQAENLIVTASDQAETYKRALEEHRSEIERRIEAIEDDQRNTIPSIERRLVTLSSRLEELESFEPNLPEVLAVPPMPVCDAPPHMEDAPAAGSAAPTDAFSPSQAVEFQPVSPPQNPYGALSEPSTEVIAEQVVADVISEEQQPQEYVPQEYVPQEYEPPAYQAAAPLVQTAQIHEFAPQQAQLQPYEYAPQPGYVPEVAAAPVLPPFTEGVPAEMGLPPMPLGAMEMDGAAQSMDLQRPGAEPEKKKRGLRRKKSGGEGSGGGFGKAGPIKLVALMAGVAAIGLFGATKVMPNLFGDKAENSSAAMPDAAASSMVAGQENDIHNDELAATQTNENPLASAAPIGDYSQAMQAPDLGQAADGGPSAQALTLEAAAADGNPVAQFQLGLSHLEAGRDAEAVRLIRLAANQGQPAAQYRLAKLYELGIGVTQNHATAMDLLALSAKGGNSVAMHDLGHYYAIGANEQEPDINTAVGWFHKAADRGIVDSQFNLGVLYGEGTGVDRDLVQSYVWYSLAAAQGDSIAGQRAERVSLDLSKKQQAQADSRLKAFTPKRTDEAANGIFRNTPWVAERTTKRAPTATIKSAQQMLVNLGYDVGTPDGAMGPKTRNAVIRFERANGLPETGRVNAALIERLSLAAGV